MKISILKEKYPKTWNEIAAFVYPGSVLSSNLYDFRFYFDSVGIYRTIESHLHFVIGEHGHSTDAIKSIYYEYAISVIIDNFLDVYYDSDEYNTRAEAEQAAIIKCFELREKELTK